MEQLFIVLLEFRACVFESVNNRFDPVCIKGEERISVKQNQANWFIQELLANLGVDDLQDWPVTIAYDPISAELLPSIMTSLFPHKPDGLEVRSLEALLPEVLLKHKLIAPGQTVTVGLGTHCWQVGLTEEGRVSGVVCLDAVTPDVCLSERDIPAALCADYTFITNHKEVEHLEARLLEMTEQCTEYRRQIYSIESELTTEKQNQLTYKLRLTDAERRLNKYKIAIDEVFELIIPCDEFEKNKIIQDFLSSSFDRPSLYAQCRLGGSKLTELTEIIHDITKLTSKTSNNLIIEAIYTRASHVLNFFLDIDLSKKFGLPYEIKDISFLKNIYFYEELSIRKLVAIHPNCPKNIIELLSEDKNETIRNIAQSRLNE